MVSLDSDDRGALAQLAILVDLAFVVEAGCAVLGWTHFGEASSLRPRLRDRPVPVLLRFLICQVDMRLDVFITLLIHLASI